MVLECGSGGDVGIVVVVRIVVVAVGSWIVRAGIVVIATTINTIVGVVGLLIYP